jgi:hypothetical protein
LPGKERHAKVPRNPIFNLWPGSHFGYTSLSKML